MEVLKRCSAAGENRMNLRGHVPRVEHTLASAVSDVDQIRETSMFLQGAVSHDDLCSFVHEVLVCVKDPTRAEL
jgi:hypothetical protein